MTHPAPNLLAAFAQGQLPDAQANDIAAHLADCADCQQIEEALPGDSLLALVRKVLPGDASTAALAESWVPVELVGHPRYRLLSWLGAGGMGVVYQAEHRLMERQVALKVISKKLTANPAAVERFQREVKAAAKLSHPNIVTAYDADQAGDLHFLVMEFIDGKSLTRLVEDGPLPVGLACEYVRQVALGLQHASEQGLVHRDIKPQNLMLTAAGQVKILDFGLAAFIAEQGSGTVTEFGQGLGTPDYVAPEQIRDAQSADGRSDIYSLGCTFYFLLTGQPPFHDGSASQKIAAHLERQARMVAEIRKDVPEAVSHIIAKMLAKEPSQRYQTPRDVAEALTAFAKVGTPPKSWLPVAVLLGTAASVLLVLAVWNPFHLMGSNTGLPIAMETASNKPSPATAQNTPATEPKKERQATAQELYQQVLKQTDSASAIRALNKYFAAETREYFDPYQRYATLLKAEHSSLEARQLLNLLVEQNPASTSARLVALKQEGGPDLAAKVRGFIAQHSDFLPAYPMLVEAMPDDTILAEREQSLVRVEFEKHGGFAKLKEFYLDAAEAERCRDFGLTEPLDLTKFLEVTIRYDSHFKGMAVKVNDKRPGKEVALSFANGVEAIGPLQFQEIGDEGRFEEGKALFELSSGKTSELTFIPRLKTDVRIFQHCGYLKGVKPGPLTFTLRYADAKGNSFTFPKTLTNIPAFQAEVIHGREAIQLATLRPPQLRLNPFEFLKTCQVAARKEGPYISVPQHISVPSIREVALAKVPGYDAKPGIHTFWAKGTTDKGVALGPEEVRVLCPDGK